MTNSASHLNKEAQALLALSDTERINRIRGERWIGYPLALQILDQLEDLLTHPKTHRMPCLSIVGDTNNGKTMIVMRMVERHPPSDNPSGDTIILPVLYIQAPTKPDEGLLYDAILEKLAAPFRHNDRPRKKRFQVITMLKRIGVLMLIIDEIHDLLAGTPAQQRVFLAVIKHLSIELQIPLVGVGLEEASVLLKSDPQLANRFRTARLPRWEMGKEYLRLLASFEAMLPLKEPSNLIAPQCAQKVLGMSEGLIGEISSILKEAAIHAIKTKKEKIDIDVLNKIRWVQPSARNQPELIGV